MPPWTPCLRLLTCLCSAPHFRMRSAALALTVAWSGSSRDRTDFASCFLSASQVDYVNNARNQVCVVHTIHLQREAQQVQTWELTLHRAQWNYIFFHQASSFEESRAQWTSVAEHFHGILTELWATVVWNMCGKESWNASCLKAELRFWLLASPATHPDMIPNWSPTYLINVIVNKISSGFHRDKNGGSILAK